MSMKVEEPPQSAGEPGRCVTRASQRPIYSAAKVLCVPPEAEQPPPPPSGTHWLFPFLAQGSEMGRAPRLGVIQLRSSSHVCNAAFSERFAPHGSRAAGP